jgi:hypothetical protein
VKSDAGQFPSRVLIVTSARGIGTFLLGLLSTTANSYRISSGLVNVMAHNLRLTLAQTTLAKKLGLSRQVTVRRVDKPWKPRKMASPDEEVGGFCRKFSPEGFSAMLLHDQ